MCDSIRGDTLTRGHFRCESEMEVRSSANKFQQVQFRHSEKTFSLLWTCFPHLTMHHQFYQDSAGQMLGAVALLFQFMCLPFQYSFKCNCSFFVDLCTVRFTNSLPSTFVYLDLKPSLFGSKKSFVLTRENLTWWQPWCWQSGRFGAVWVYTWALWNKRGCHQKHRSQNNQHWHSDVIILLSMREQLYSLFPHAILWDADFRHASHNVLLLSVFKLHTAELDAKVSYPAPCDFLFCNWHQQVRWSGKYWRLCTHEITCHNVCPPVIAQQKWFGCSSAAANKDQTREIFFFFYFQSAGNFI